MSVFNYLDYRPGIRWLVEARKKVQPAMTYERLANAIGVQKSYLSQVLNGSAELSQDQLYLLCEYFELDREKRAYFSLLLEHSRCGLEKRKAVLQDEIREIQKRHHVSEAYLEVNPVEINAQGINDYYLDPYNQLVHICLSQQRFRQDPSQLAPLLGLGAARLQEVLLELERLQVIEVGEKGIEVVKRNLHLPKEAKVFASWRGQMRKVADDRLNRMDSGDNYSFSVVFSTTDEVRDEIHKKFLEFIRWAQNRSKGTSSEQVLQMNFDLIRWI